MNIIRRFFNKPTCQCLINIASTLFQLIILTPITLLFVSWIFGLMMFSAYLLIITGPLVGIPIKPDDKVVIDVNNVFSFKYINILLNYDNYTDEEIFIAIAILCALTVIPAIFIGICKCYYYEFDKSTKKSLLFSLFVFFYNNTSFLFIIMDSCSNFNVCWYWIQ